MSSVLSFFDTVDLIRRFRALCPAFAQGIVVNAACTVEVAFHLILYYRQVYPPGLFERTKRWNIEIWTCRHPALQEYIGKAVSSVAEEMRKRTLSSVSLVIKTADVQGSPLEKFTFDTEWFLPSDEKPVEPQDFIPQNAGMSSSSAEHYLRSLIAKISAVDAYMTPLPENVTFAIVLQLEEGAPPPPEVIPSRAARTTWVPADEGDVPDSTRNRELRKDVSVLPIKSTRLGMVNLGLNVVEWDAKARAREAEFLSSSGQAGPDSSATTPPRKVDKGKGKATDW